jgi:hypothetical protein
MVGVNSCILLRQLEATLTLSKLPSICLKLFKLCAQVTLRKARYGHSSTRV